MLVLSRKMHETIQIGGGSSGLPVIIIEVVNIDRGKIRLGITAPQSVPIHRTELLDGSAKPASTDAAHVAG